MFLRCASSFGNFLFSFVPYLQTLGLTEWNSTHKTSTGSNQGKKIPALRGGRGHKVSLPTTRMLFAIVAVGRWEIRAPKSCLRVTGQCKTDYLILYTFGFILWFGVFLAYWLLYLFSFIIFFLVFKNLGGFVCFPWEKERKIFWEKEIETYSEHKVDG